MSVASPRAARTARASAPSKLSAPASAGDALSTQVCFRLHSIQGAHVREQGAVVCVNGVTFVLAPRTAAPCVRYYEGAYCVFVAPGEAIRFSVGVFTPEDGASGFFHCFVRYNVAPPPGPIRQNLVLESIGGAYAINVSLFAAPSLRASPHRACGSAASSARASPRAARSLSRSRELA
jgi:hypothetical protein